MPENQIEKINLRFGEIRSALKYGQKEFALAAGIKQSQVSEIENGKRNITSAIKIALEDNLNVNRKWLETEHGEMFLTHSNILREPSVEYKVTQIKAISVPIYDVEFAPGIMTNLIAAGDDHYPVGYLAIPEVQGCDAVIRARGDGMAGKINDRDWIGVKRVVNWQEWLPLGYIYAISTDNQELVRYLKKGSTKDFFTLESHNKFYDDQEIPKHLIKEIWSVKAILPFAKIETLI